MSYFIYALFRSNGQPFYIGKGSGKRISLTLNPNTGGNKYKSNLIRQTKTELGSAPYVLLHQNLDEATAFAYEIALIQAIGRYPDGPLVNFTDGGEGIRNASPEVRAAIAQKLTGNRNAAGCIPTPETRALLSKIKLGNTYNLGRTQTAQHVSNRRDALKAYAASAEGKAAAQRLSEARRGKPRPPEVIAKMKATKARKALEKKQAAFN